MSYKILAKMVSTCPVCKGTGEVKKWEAIDPVSKIATGWYVGKKPCPYCGAARKFLKQKGLFDDGQINQSNRR